MHVVEHAFSVSHNTIVASVSLILAETELTCACSRTISLVRPQFHSMHDFMLDNRPEIDYVSYIMEIKVSDSADLWCQ